MGNSRTFHFATSSWTDRSLTPLPSNIGLHDLCILPRQGPIPLDSSTRCIDLYRRPRTRELEIMKHAKLSQLIRAFRFFRLQLVASDFITDKD